MNRVDVRDIIGGLSVIAIGLFAVVQSLQYEVGSIRHMGPGYFPLILSSIFTILGVCILVPAFFRKGSGIEVQPKELLVVLVGIIVFALTIRPLGIIVSIIATVIVAGLAGKISFVGSIILGVVVSILSYLVFVLGLGMTIPVWPWSN